MAVDPTSYRKVTSFVFSGEQGDPARLANRLAAGNTVFISSVLSEKYGLGPGDTIRLATRRGERDFEIVAVVVDFYNQGLVVQGSWKDLRRYFGVNDVSAFLLKAEPGRSPREVRDRIERLYGRSQHLTLESNEAIRSPRTRSDHPDDQPFRRDVDHHDDGRCPGGDQHPHDECGGAHARDRDAAQPGHDPAADRQDDPGRGRHDGACRRSFGDRVWGADVAHGVEQHEPHGWVPVGVHAAPRRGGLSA